MSLYRIMLAIGILMAAPATIWWNYHRVIDMYNYGILSVTECCGSMPSPIPGYLIILILLWWKHGQGND